MFDLQEIEAIKRLKYKYMRCLDNKLWEEMAECFAENATCSYSGGKYEFSGRETILNFFRESMDPAHILSSHTVHHPEIDVTSETTATGIWRLEDVYIDDKQGFAIQGAAWYRDEYVKLDGGWKLQHTGYKRTWEEMVVRKDDERLSMLQRWSDKTGASSGV
jgi:hypothetical protein